ncbi:MAG: site-specific DNA-methyltransferase [Veillonellaceae bacterium]|nr:site-specific DNA-methyltransferase [Veillonellaceae bacterium]
MDGKSRVPHQELIELLRQKAPMIFTEDRIDPDKLKQTFGESVNIDNERYGLNWAGKSDCFRHIQEPTTATLKPVREESVDFDNTENIFIEGENLQVLKVLQKSYYGKIKMIYIDPPYNTGNDSFIYPDRFQESKEDYLQRVGDKDEEGNLTNEGIFRKNSRDNGHYHSNWLSMMYPRLFLARNLLRQDGVIFVSIDDNEVHNLRVIMNEIFGEDNFIADIIWEKRYTRSNDAKLMASIIDHLLLYRRNSSLNELREQRSEKSDSIYSNPDNDPKGTWTSVSYVSQRTRTQRPNLCYKVKNPFNGKEIEHPTNAWKYSKEQYKKHEAENRLYWGKSGGHQYPRLKKYLNELKEGVVPINLWKYSDSGSIDEGTKEVDSIIGKDIFDYPKPTKLIQRMLKMGTSVASGDIVLDFFAGSGSTADAVISLNAIDGGNRKSISIQLAEPCSEQSSAFEKGFKTISEIATKRIKRAFHKIYETQKDELNLTGRADTGLKIFHLSESNFKIWRNDVSTEQELIEQMNIFIDNVKGESSKENILYELILKTGLDLNIKVEVKQVEDKEYFSLGSDKMIVCLEDEINQSLVDAILNDKPEKVVLLDKSFKSNDQLKTNTLLQMESVKIDFKVI